MSLSQCLRKGGFGFIFLLQLTFNLISSHLLWAGDQRGGVFNYLNLREVKPNPPKGARLLKLAEILEYLGEFVYLPEVTVQDVENLRAADVTTSIIQPMPAFYVAKWQTPVGLYRAVMGDFPNLDLPMFPQDQYYPAGYLREKDKKTIREVWEANPYLPLGFTTVAEDLEFAEKLSQILGRHFGIMSDAQNEYAIRGRALIHGEPTGDITTSKFYFGDNREELKFHAWTYQSPRPEDWFKIYDVREQPPGYEQTLKHPFGLFQVLGNVWTRSPEGVLRGGSTLVHDSFSLSSAFKKVKPHERHISISSRLFFRDSQIF